MKRLRRTLPVALAVMVILAAGMTTARPVSAHTEESDGTLSAVLHIYPDDHLKSKTPTTYRLSFTDSAGQFSLMHCDCTAEFKDNDQVISSEKLVPINPTTSANGVTFPRAGIYELVVSGQSVQSDSFKPFVLTFSLKADPQDTVESSQSVSPLLALGLVAMVALVLLGASRMKGKA